jgi:hypothetical protein
MVDLGDTNHCVEVAPPLLQGDGSCGLVARNVSGLDSTLIDLKQTSKPRAREQGENQNDLKLELRPNDEPSGKEVCGDIVLSWR